MEKAIKFWITGLIDLGAFALTMKPLALSLGLAGVVKKVALNKIEGIITGDDESMRLFLKETERTFALKISSLTYEDVVYQPTSPYLEFIDEA
jgi:acylphosphatase